MDLWWILFFNRESFERYMPKLESRNGYQKGTCHDETGLCIHNIETIRGSM